MIQRLLYELAYLLKRTPWDTGISPPELMAYLDTHPPGRALDLGCGTGTNAITMAKRGWRVVGVDLSGRAIRRAMKKAEIEKVRVEFRQEDVSQLTGLDGPFDLALDIGCLHGLPAEARTQYAANLARLLNPAGTYLLYTWLRSEENSRRMIPRETDIRNMFSPVFDCTNVDYGTDGRHKAAWFTFQRK